MRQVMITQFIVALSLLLLVAGCGAAVQKTGTEQLVLSDSVDRAIDQLDLAPLAGRKVFLDADLQRSECLREFGLHRECVAPEADDNWLPHGNQSD